MSSGISTQGSRGLSATGAVRTVTDVRGSGEQRNSPESYECTAPTGPRASRPLEQPDRPHSSRSSRTQSLRWRTSAARGWRSRTSAGPGERKSCASPCPVTEAKADMGECEYGQSDADPQESIRDVSSSPVRSERCSSASGVNAVRHDSKDGDEADGIQQRCRVLGICRTLISRGSCDSKPVTKKSTLPEVADDGAAFQRCQRELDRRER